MSTTNDSAQTSGKASSQSGGPSGIAGSQSGGPSSYWIFGYGSLVWKVDFPFYKSVVGYIKGFKRRFWLASTDHRGYPGNPGRVVTLIASDDPEEKVWGVAYEIPMDEATRKHLDHREAGGYSRQDAIFYPIKECCVNDTFKLPKEKESGDASKSETEIPVTVFIASEEVEEYLGPQTLESIADVIAVSVGPSGKNTEYLLNLAVAMKELVPDAEDDHLYGLERLVRQKIKE